MRRILLSFLLAVAVAGPGITGTRIAEAADATVTFTDRANPAALTVAPGARVTFANQSGARKRVRSEDGPVEFDSGNLESGASWSVVLNAAGTYAYVDDRDRDNPAYHGTITVSTAAQPGGTPAAPAPSAPPAGSPAPSAPTTASVTILDRSFSPASVTVAPGGTVSWTNQSDRDHTVTGAGFDSGVLGGGGRFSHTFPSAGTFSYVCEIHSEMRASVTVTTSVGGADQPALAPAAPTTSPAPTVAAPRPAAPQPQTPSPGGRTAAVRHDVGIVDYAFRPASIAARVGDTVVWTNQGRAPHTSTAAGLFDTGMIRTGEQRTTPLQKAGTFTFACSFHPEMTGTLTVAPAAGGSAAGVQQSPPATATGATATPDSPTTATAAPPAAEERLPDSAEVSIVDFAFEPTPVRLAVGGTVTWRHNGIAPHTVSASDGAFDSGVLKSAGVFSHQFDQAGTYQYVCAFHPQMVGTVEVSDGPSPAASDGAVSPGEQAVTTLNADAQAGTSNWGALLAAVIGAAALLAGFGAFLYGGSRMAAADERR